MVEYHINALPEDKFDNKVVVYFMPVVPTPENIKEFRTKFHEIFQNISKLSEEYVLISLQRHVLEKPQITKMSTRYDKPIQDFLLGKLAKLQLKLNQFRSSFYEAKARILNDVSVYIMNCYETEGYMNFDLEGYKKYVVKEYMAHPVVQKTFYRSKCIQSYLHRLDLEIEERLNLKLMKSILTNATQNIDQTLEFSPYNSFDYAFSDFTFSSKTIQRFDICVKNVIKTLTKRRINMRELDQVNKSFNLLFDPQNSNERLVMHSAIVRVMFDEISLVKNFFLFSDENSEQFVQKCSILRKMNPKQLKIAENLMKPDMMEQPFEEIVQASPDLIEATRMINCLHFLTNPYDIVYQTFKAVRLIDQFVKINMGGKSNTNMSFDDVFSLFCPVMSIDPPKNAVALSRFLLGVEGLQFSQPLDFAKIVLSSSVDYIANKSF